jgi:hypothetical protein
LEGTFEVTHGGQPVGTVELKREGLYCHIFCRCRVADAEIHRLYAEGEKIGVLIPDRGELVLETKVAAKRLKEGCAFSLDGKPENFILICPGEAFGHLDKLRSSKLVFRDGKPGMILGK